MTKDNANLFPSIPGGVCAPRGFRSHGVACGIKVPVSTRLDLALIASDFPCTAGGVFTQNRVCAAPVQVCRKHLAASATHRAILANSGNANACTGERGMEDARRMARMAASALGLREEEVFVASTGIIGMPLPFERLEAQTSALMAGLQSEHSDSAAQAIMTSDTKPKQCSIQVDSIRIGGIAKGAGMICPDMATMLCFITTDAAISKADLQTATRIAADRTFNRITIDGDTSTNDTVIVLANGTAGPVDLARFQAGLNQVMLDLAQHIVRDGERVTKFVEVRVEGARSQADALRVAQAVANSNLVKSSWNGEDPNWGRVIHAVGYAGAELDPSKIDIYFDDLPAAIGGLSAPTPLDDLVEVARRAEFCIRIDLHLGDGCETVYSSDLSPEYVDFNRSEYAASLARQRQKGLA